MYCLFNGKTTETVNPPDDSVGLSQMASGTDGNLITFDASGNPAYVATGNDGQVLTSAGAGQPCLFEDASGGAWAVKSSGTFSSASQLDVTSIAKYTKIILTNVTFSNGAQMYFRTSTDNGSSFVSSSDYHYHMADYSSSRSNPTDVVGYTGTTRDAIFSSGDNCGTASTDEAHYIITIPNPTDTASATIIKIEFMGITASAANVIGSTTVGMSPIASDVDAIRAYPAAGTISGSYTVIELN